MKPPLEDTWFYEEGTPTINKHMNQLYQLPIPKRLQYTSHNIETITKIYSKFCSYTKPTFEQDETLC